MAKVSQSLYQVVQLRVTKRRWVYLACLALVLVLAVWSLGEGPKYMIPYIPILLLLVIQFFRPTLLGWFLAFALFVTFAGAIAIKGSFTEEYLAGLLIGVVPALVLLWARPRRLAQAKNVSSELAKGDNSNLTG